MRKRDLIYHCVTEAVMEARIETAQLDMDKKTLDLVDTILFRAQLRVGRYALKAIAADARKVHTYTQVIREDTDD